MSFRGGGGVRINGALQVSAKHFPGACFRLAVGVLLILFGLGSRTSAYSLLTHEQIVDIVWKDDIEPLLQQQFPAATQQDLHEPHAYAYRRCLGPDFEHYPLGYE